MQPDMTVLPCRRESGRQHRHPKRLYIRAMKNMKRDRKTEMRKFLESQEDKHIEDDEKRNVQETETDMNVFIDTEEE